MAFQTTKLAFVILLGGMSLFVGSSAKAGFIVTDLELSAGQAKLMLGASCTSSGDVTTARDALPSRAEVEHVGVLFSGASGTMGGQPTSGFGSGVGPSAVLVDTVIDAATVLLAWLGPEGRVWLPPPFLSGIFRPPRFTVG